MIGNHTVVGKNRGSRLLLSIMIVVATTATFVCVAYFSARKWLSRADETDVFSQETPRMGKRITLENSGPPLTVEQIGAFEKEIGGRLPEDYKRFLMSHNGGLCAPELGLPWAGTVHTIGCFSALLPATEYSGIRNNLRRLRELNAAKTDGYVPIASTHSECEICVAYRGKDAGAVFFTAYRYRIAHANDDLIPIDVTMVPLADSFSEFLDCLVEIPNPYCRIEDLGKRGTRDDLEQYVAEGNSIDAVGKNHLTIVCEAIKFDNAAMIRACIERGASLSGSIEIAVGNGHVHLIEMLVKAGANINERNEFGVTPLHYVVGTALPGEEGARNRAMRSLLIKLGATE